MRCIATHEDFPVSWATGEIALPSHEASHYFRTYQVRLDAASSAKLDPGSRYFAASASEVMHQLIVQATPKDVPRSGQMAVHKRPQARGPKPS
jgi:hypothetical protein